MIQHSMFERYLHISARSNYSLLTFFRFTVNNKTGEIKTAVALDRETEDTHTIRIIAKDGGSKIFESEVTVHINVTDVNDHRPVFGQRYYQVAVVEQQPAQTVLNLAVSV